MNKDLYTRLVDMYAGQELTEELVEEIETAAMGDPELAHDLFSLRRTVDALQSIPPAPYTEETDVRIKLLMQMRGADVRSDEPQPSYWQYHLPIQS